MLYKMNRNYYVASAAGDPEAFTILFNHYWPRIYSSMLVISKSPSVAEDIAQEIFTRIVERQGKSC